MRELARDGPYAVHVFAVVFPGAACGGTGARDELIEAASLRVYDGICRRVRAGILGIRNSICIGIEFPGERETCVKRALKGDVGPYAEPIRRKIVISNPALQIG